MQDLAVGFGVIFLTVLGPMCPLRFLKQESVFIHFRLYFLSEQL